MDLMCIKSKLDTMICKIKDISEDVDVLLKNAKESEEQKCKYAGCKEPAGQNNDGFCHFHMKVKCVMCGDQAIHGFPGWESFPFSGGQPLCGKDECFHKLRWKAMDRKKRLIEEEGNNGFEFLDHAVAKRWKDIPEEEYKHFHYKEQLAFHIAYIMRKYGKTFDWTSDKINFHFYIKGENPITKDRWKEVYLVTVDGYGVVGMTNAAVSDREIIQAFF